MTVPPKPDQGVPPPPPSPDQGVPPPPPPTQDQGVVVPPQSDLGTAPSADSGIEPSYADSGLPALDQGGAPPPAAMTRSQLTGGCAIAGTAPSQGLALCLGLLLLVALRRRRR